MVDKQARYEEAKAAFARPGNRWEGVKGLTWWGALNGMTAEKIMEDAHELGIHDQDQNIARGWRTAKMKQCDWQPSPAFYDATRARRPPPEKRKVYAGRVAELIGKGADCRDLEELRRLSPCYGKGNLDDPEEGWIEESTELWLQAAFAGNELLFMDNSATHARGNPGENIRTAAEWVEMAKHDKPPLPGDLIMPQPLTGEQGLTTDGKESYTAQQCIAAFPYLIIEFDDMPLDKQCSFWAGFIRDDALSDWLLSLTFSGGKSIHGVIYVGKSNLEDWQRTRDRVTALLCASDDATMRADAQAMRQRTSTRLPGVRRLSNNNQQRLIYLNPQVREDSLFSDYIRNCNTPGNPEKLGCGICSRYGVCDRRDPNAIPGTSLIRGHSLPTAAAEDPLPEETPAARDDDLPTGYMALDKFIERGENHTITISPAVEQAVTAAIENQQPITAEVALLAFLRREHGYHGYLPALIEKLHLPDQATAREVKRIVISASESWDLTWRGWKIRKGGRDQHGMMYLMREEVILPERPYLPVGREASREA